MNPRQEIKFMTLGRGSTWMSVSGGWMPIFEERGVAVASCCGSFRYAASFSHLCVVAGDDACRTTVGLRGVRKLQSYREQIITSKLPRPPGTCQVSRCRCSTAGMYEVPVSTVLVYLSRLLRAPFISYKSIFVFIVCRKIEEKEGRGGGHRQTS